MASKTKNVLQVAASKGEIRQLPNGLVLSGVWKDYHDVFIALSDKEQHLQEALGFLSEDRDSLIYERVILFQKWKQDMASLTEVETSHLQAQQLIDHVRSEQRVLQGKVSSLEAQRMWLEKEREDLRSQSFSESLEIQQLRLQLTQVQSELDTEKGEVLALQNLVYDRDETIEALKVALQKRDEEIEVLRKSVATKDRQFHTLVKERDRLRGELDVAQKQLSRPKPLLNRSSSSSAAAKDGRRPYASKYSSDEDEESSTVDDDDDCNHVDEREQSKRDECDKDNDVTVFTPEKTMYLGHDAGISTGGTTPVVTPSSTTDIASLLIGDISISRERFDIRERQYQAIIRKLQQNLLAAKAAKPNAAAAATGGGSYRGTPPVKGTAARTPPSLNRSQTTAVSDRSTPICAFSSTKPLPSPPSPSHASSSSSSVSNSRNTSTPLASYSKTGPSTARTAAAAAVHGGTDATTNNRFTATATAAGQVKGNDSSSNISNILTGTSTPRKNLFPSSPDVSLIKNSASPSVSILMSSPPRAGKNDDV